MSARRNFLVDLQEGCRFRIDRHWVQLMTIDNLHLPDSSKQVSLILESSNHH